MRRSAIPGTLLAALLAACSGADTSAHQPRNVAVQLAGFAISPAEATVAVGDTVSFQNRDMVPHNVTSGSAFDSDTIKAGAEWRWVARQKGRYDYICAYHPTMKGSIIVE